MYNYYAGVTNPSACSETPSNWPTGTNNNGDVAGYYYNDVVNTGLNHKATYTYDGVNRLKTAAATGSSTYSQTFTLRCLRQHGLSASPSEVECLAPTYSATSNRITTSGYTYDRRGERDRRWHVHLHLGRGGAADQGGSKWDDDFHQDL